MSSRRLRTVAAVILICSGARKSEGAGMRTRRPPRTAPATCLVQPATEEEGCLATFRSAEMHVQAGQLRAAQKELVECAQRSCGKFLRRQCATRLSDLAPEVPSVIPLVSDGSGKIVRDVHVAVDADAPPQPADGHAIFVDPGSHEFTFTTAGEVIARETVNVLPGQRNHLIRAALTKAPTAQAAPRHEHRRFKMVADDPAPEPSPREAEPALAAPSPPLPAGARRAPLLALTLGGAGLVAAGAGVLLTRWGRADNDRLAACSPACPGAAVSHVHQLYIGADVAFGVAAVAMVGAAWAYWHRGSHKAEIARGTTVRLDVRPTVIGAIAGVGGTF